MADERVSHWEGVYREKDDSQLSWHQDDPSISLELCDMAGLNIHAGQLTYAAVGAALGIPSVDPQTLVTA